MKLPPNSLVAAGPVIIENGQILLNREQKPDGETPWLIPGDEVEDFDVTLEEACQREVKEEMGLEIEIVRPLKTILLRQPDRVVILVHFLANRRGEITPGANIVEWGWHDIHSLPPNCAANVVEIVKEFL